MEITTCTRADFDQIQRDLAAFWGGTRTAQLHHPTLLYEFGTSAFVIRDGDTVAAYLFGFLAQTGPTGYVHLVGVRAAYRRRGLGRRLYERFIAFARAHGCTRIKAITTPDNRRSIAFHRSLGMALMGTPNDDGVPVVRNYRGPGRDAVVFEMEIRPA